MSDDLEQLEAWVGGLMAKLSSAERRTLARQVATDLRRSQVKRITEQRNPDGSRFEPRKRQPALRSKAGRIKRQAKARAMFPKLRQAGFLKADASASVVSVGFNNPTVARVARVHQFGLRDRVTRQAGAPEVKYPARTLLGFTEEDRARLLDAVLRHLDGKR